MKSIAKNAKFMKNISIKVTLISTAALLIVGTTVYAKYSDASAIPKAKRYDGIITQMDQVNGSFTLRFRDGSLVKVKNPLVINLFVNVKGVLDPLAKAIDQVTEIVVKDDKGADVIPNILFLDPGSGTVGTNITVSGTGFTKKKNSVSVGDVKDAVVNLSSKDGKVIFSLPPAPCNQRTKTNCPTSVLAPGTYNLVISNENGASNPISFTVTPLPPLTINTDVLPQVVGGTRYSAIISAVGGSTGYVWRVSEGNLPPGLLFAQALCKETPCKTSAVISGIPTTPGNYQFTVTLTSGRENISRQFLIIVVQPLGNPGY